ncbi:MAG: BON domain-containing protein [Acidobacteria bacterium]|nr:BON domain-containing protein [Acidobacteriota bacterium]
MSKLIPSPKAILLATLVLLTGLCVACNSAPSPAPTAMATPAATMDPCATVTDAALIKEISDKIKADPQFEKQLGHIAVNSKNRVVMLLGWANGEAAVNTLSQYAGAVKCVSKVENRLNTKLTVGCGNDQEDCPGVGCVPIGQCAPPVGTGQNQPSSNN